VLGVAQRAFVAAGATVDEALLIKPLALPATTTVYLTK
jgi:hypothetical protein